MSVDLSAAVYLNANGLRRFFFKCRVDTIFSTDARLAFDETDFH